MNGRTSLVVLRTALGVVLGGLAVLTLLHRAGGHGGHLEVVIQAIALAEVVGALLLLAPRTSRAGAAVLVVVLAAAIAVHLLHGEWNVGALVIDAAAAQVFLWRGSS